MSNKGRRPNKKELSLWERVKQTIDPIERGEHADDDFETLLAEENVGVTLSKPKASKAVDAPKRPKIKESQPPAGQSELDGKRMKRLRQGKIRVEGTIDLHGMTQDQAHNRLKGFVTKAFERKKRCVLVITGKGTRSESGVGVLKSSLPLWISVSPLNEIVLRYEPAHLKDGGDGAFYLYLKKHPAPQMK